MNLPIALRQRLTPAVVIYCCGVLITVLNNATAPTLSANHRVAPAVGMIQAALFCAGFLLCAVAPFFARGSVKQRIGFLIFAILGYSASNGAVLGIYILVFGFPRLLQ